MDLENESNFIYRFISNLEGDAVFKYNIVSPSALLENDLDFNYVFCDRIIKFEKEAFWTTGNSYSSITGTTSYVPLVMGGNLILGNDVSGTTINAWRNGPIDITGYPVDRVWEAMISCYLPSGNLTFYIASGTSSSQVLSTNLVKIETNDDLRNLNINGNLWVKFGIEFNH